ncbi:MAG: YciI family protein [Alphaproteobacteria bacterium]
MQFIVIGRDGKDADALARRMAARAAHIALGDKLVASGNLLMGVALLDGEGKMCGSVLLCDFASREALDGWLREEPYVTGQVWKETEVVECRVGPSFQNILEKITASSLS